MALSAALPVNWSPILVYFGITIILGLSTGPASRARSIQVVGSERRGLSTAAF